MNTSPRRRRLLSGALGAALLVGGFGAWAAPAAHAAPVRPDTVQSTADNSWRSADPLHNSWRAADPLHNSWR